MEFTTGKTLLTVAHNGNSSVHCWVRWIIWIRLLVVVVFAPGLVRYFRVIVMGNRVRLTPTDGLSASQLCRGVLPYRVPGVPGRPGRAGRESCCSGTAAPLVAIDYFSHVPPPVDGMVTGLIKQSCNSVVIHDRNKIDGRGTTRNFPKFHRTADSRDEYRKTLSTVVVKK